MYNKPTNQTKIKHDIRQNVQESVTWILSTTEQL